MASSIHSSKLSSPLFKSLTNLLKYLEEAIKFIDSFLLQKSAERIQLLNKNLFMKIDAKKEFQYKKYQDLDLRSFIIEGPKRNREALTVIETFLSLDAYFVQSDVLRNYQTYLTTSMVEVILSKRFLEEAKILLPKKHAPKNSREFAIQQSMRHELQSKAVELLFRNSIDANYKTTVKLMITNFMYQQSIVFSLKKAKECFQVQ